MAVLYGIVSCETCREARNALNSAGVDVDFRDVRADPLDRNDLAGFFAVFGTRLLNTRSTTWRGLGAEVQLGNPVDLLLAHPTLMKRPLIKARATLTLGWDAAAQAAHLGDGSAGA